MIYTRSKMNIVAEIPARAGSQRVKNKNMRLLDGKPLISYAIQAAKSSKLLTDIYVNSDSDEIGEFGTRHGIRYYKRPDYLGGDNYTSDDYNYDFFKVNQPDILVQVNPVCPFVTGKDIDEIVQSFLDNDRDSLVTVREEPFQAFCDGIPINFDVDKRLPRTQDILPILLCAWPVCVWKKDTFMNSFEKNGHAVFSGNLELYPVSFLTGLKISYEKDFALAEKLMSMDIKL
jgi:CMP-N-acetylneuraminic acid synthetase